ncbi:MAG: hypothetical protein IJ575_08020 [Selenomonadaceae bacterium]|nr:hypothetical protein [Selenomonadaceae bacterium]
MEYSKKQKMLDAMIVGVAIFVLGTLDYDNLRTMDYIYLVSFGFWIVTFVIRLYLMYKRGML